MSREVDITPEGWILGSGEGVRVTAAEDGLRIEAWYDSFIVLVHGTIPWHVIERARRAVKPSEELEPREGQK